MSQSERPQEKWAAQPSSWPKHMMSSKSKEKIIEIMKFVFNFIIITIIIPIKINFIQIS